MLRKGGFLPPTSDCIQQVIIILDVLCRAADCHPGTADAAEFLANANHHTSKGAKQHPQVWNKGMLVALSF